MFPSRKGKDVTWILSKVSSAFHLYFENSLPNTGPRGIILEFTVVCVYQEG